MRLTRPALFLLLGVAFAILAGVLVYGITRQATARTVDPLADTTQIVVAKADIPEFSVLSAAMLDLRRYPNALVPKGAVASVDAAIGQTTLTKIPAGAPVLGGQIAAVGGATGYSAQLAKGKVLVAFTANDPLIAAKLVKAGDHVDIVATITPQQLTAPTPGPVPTPVRTGSPAPAPEVAAAFPVSQIVVQDLEVVGVVGNNVLTFIVDSQTALVLKNLRDSSAVIDIFVRSAVDKDSHATSPVDISTISKQFRFR